MTNSISRRGFLKGLAASALVVGFDPIRRTWITAADAASKNTQSANNFPNFLGSLYFDEASRTAAADDFGHIIHRTPVAVLKPACALDVVLMVQFANRVNIKIGPRGTAHSTYGQMQAEGGVVIDTSTLNTIYSINADYADVESGVIWRDIITAALAQGRTPPVTTDYLDLSVGGTLSVGGIGGMSHQEGLLIDNALELQVVTGEGDLEWCSAKKKRKLFEAVLGGLGQCAIIVRARVRLVTAKQSARVYTAFYDDINLFTQDQLLVVQDKRFNYVEGQVVTDGSGGWRFMLEAAKFFNANSMPNDSALLAGLHYNAGEVQIADQTYFDFINRLQPTIEFLKAIGIWGFPHPWYDVFLPQQNVVSYVADVLADLTLDDTGQGPILLYPVPRNVLTRPFFRVPNSQYVFLFDILRTAPPIPAVVSAMVADNRELFEEARDQGGYRYTNSSIPFTPADWEQHFGASWSEFRKAKRQYDPNNILTPGQNIFV